MEEETSQFPSVQSKTSAAQDLPGSHAKPRRAGRQGAAEEGVPAQAWRRVHPVTPMLNSWQALAALLAVLLFQNFEVLGELKEVADTSGVALVLLIALGVIVVILAVIGVYSYLAWRAMSYAVTDQAVWLREGIVFRKQRHVRLERIQAVDVTHPLLGRVFGLGRLTVEAAGGAGSSLAIGYLKDETLWDLRAEILARAAGLEVTDSTSGGPEVANDASQTAVNPSPAGSLRGALEAPEDLVYSVNAKTLIQSLLLSGGVLISAFLALACAVCVAVLMATQGPAAGAVAFPALIPAALVFASFLWTRFSREFNFQAAVSPDGIRVRRGLLERKSETIPPRRVHAITIYQPLLWRGRGWYRIQISQASGVNADKNEAFSSQVLLPVGSREEAAKALWLVVSDLGVEDPERFLADALESTGPSRFFTGVPTRARIFNPLTYKRKGISLTDTTVVVRDGWLTRSASFAPYERIQSVKGSYGPLAAGRRLEDVRACLVIGPVVVAISNLAVEDGERIRAELVERSREKRVQEPPERWFARVRSVGDDREADADEAEDITRFAPPPSRTEEGPTHG